MKTLSAVSGVGAVPIEQATRMDRIHRIAIDLHPRERRLDWPEAIGLAIDAFDAGKRGEPRATLAGHNPALWAVIRNRGAAIRAFELLCMNPDEFVAVPI